MTKERGFEIVTKYEQAGIQLPKRATAHAAGYDIQAAADMLIPADGTIKLVPTGLKAYMQTNEVLYLINRSSGPYKRGLVLPNSVGVIDADYYNNEKNEGEIFVQIQSISGQNVQIKKGDRIVQAIFMPFLTVDDDRAAGLRQGGFGSTGE
ncbi:deoxyuridine 5'-triphosphate nucleotidohydrolase [Oenococcus kitaharae]|nr:deoxyuridine 5'-triphosphate nucleotidohydrolase [Oenococcus kitaharae]MCV3296863.1 dUTP diphosphatase [Oenococcus kitaharae]OEY81925.1 deoxyuridine 5'-triphosphate nucleotidohydrolase [Oenococcus kitaharae]OEY84137.1 deoxyuridine 5'-triphosphate nucleotidohydrolase [Oenococcus kitaharae]OEY85619.1 deoxyuridine 5'-triphosphate nucleotidohydrolase [Oenococcus kitaharae]